MMCNLILNDRLLECPITTSYSDADYTGILDKLQLMYATAANKLYYETEGGARSNPLLMIDGERATQIVVNEGVNTTMFIGTGGSSCSCQLSSCLMAVGLVM